VFPRRHQREIVVLLQAAWVQISSAQKKGSSLSANLVSFLMNELPILAEYSEI
jgi:hypothetical protein